MKRTWARKGEIPPPVTYAETRQIPPVVRLDTATRPSSIVSSPSLPRKSACYDCGSTTRPLTQVSPKIKLCATDIRKRKKAKNLASREARQQQHFGITIAEGELITELQGGGCICMPWTGYNGKSRSLSTDHDHKTGQIRGKLCKHCNDLLGRVRDDPRYFERMIAYLRYPPAERALGKRYVPEGR